MRRSQCSAPVLIALLAVCIVAHALQVDHLNAERRAASPSIHETEDYDGSVLLGDEDAHHLTRHLTQAPSGQWHEVHAASRVHTIPRMPAHPLSDEPQPVMLERASVSSEITMAADLGAQTGLAAALSAMGTVAISADAAAEQQAILQEPGVRSALQAKTPDAVDKLIQGILDGTGKGGVVTSEFNQNGVHATIISNVNELRVTQLVDAAQAGVVLPQSNPQVATPAATPRFRARRHSPR